MIRIRLLGREFKLSITDFNLALGFIDKSTQSLESMVRVFVTMLSHFSLFILRFGKMSLLIVCEDLKICLYFLIILFYFE